jgi:hypothetical protein
MNKTRLRFFVALGLLCGILTQRALAVDHNNVDAGRPLSFDDAEAIAYRERAVEAGLTGSFPNDGKAGLGLGAEFLYGFALNNQISVDADPSVGGRAGSDETRFDAGDVGVGLLHNFNREIGNIPAFALRSDVFFPTGRDSDGVKVRLRGILSKYLIQYDRIHLNLDGTYISEPQDNERQFLPAVVLGYSKPIGYPKSFNRTGSAEIGVRQGETFGTGPIVRLGVGLRQQVTVRSVVDIGFQSDVVASRNAPHDDARLIAGYSVSF